jgi:6-phosphogluconolactonase
MKRVSRKFDAPSVLSSRLQPPGECRFLLAMTTTLSHPAVALAHLPSTTSTFIAFITPLVLLLGLGAGDADAAPFKEYFAYIGTYTGAKSKGIYIGRLDTTTGMLTSPELAAEITSPSFLAVHPNNRLLYAVNEVNKFEGKNSGAVSAFAIDPATGKLKLLNQVSSVGAGPCYLIVDRMGMSVLVANYGSGSVAALAIKPDGSLGEATAFIQHTGSSINSQRQKEPHAHSINVSPDNHFAIAADLGLDKLLVYRFDPRKGTLAPNDPPFTAVAPGSGPRHFAFHPDGRHAYVINEILCTVTAFDYSAPRGELKELQTISTLPPGEAVKPGYSTAEVQVHPTGKFLYGSNRGHDTIVVFAIDERTGRLTHVQNEPTQGKIPRNFAIDPTGQWLLAENSSSDSIVLFRIDTKTGQLSAAGQKIEVGSPVCVKFVPAK